LTKIFLIRHAEAEGNIFRRAHGHVNGQIIGRGYKQIEQLEKRFLREKISAVYSSDLTRAVITANAVSRPRGMQVNTTELLREVRMGAWEDEAWGNLHYENPNMVRVFSNDPARWNVKGGEEYALVRSRMTGCIKEIARQNDGESIAVVSHGFAIRSLLCEIIGIPSNEIARIPYCDNTAVSLLKYENGKLSVEFHSDNSHLKGDTSTFAHQAWWRSERESVEENVRFAPLDERRDNALLESLYREGFSRNNADKEYAAFLADVPVGIVGLYTERNIAHERGTGSGEPETGDIGDSAGWIAYMYILPGYRRMNYGVQLLGQAVTEFRRQRKAKLRVNIPPAEAAVNFCDKFGFIKREEADSSLLMEKNIRNW